MLVTRHARPLILVCVALPPSQPLNVFPCLCPFMRWTLKLYGLWELQTRCR